MSHEPRHIQWVKKNRKRYKFPKKGLGKKKKPGRAGAATEGEDPQEEEEAPEELPLLEIWVDEQDEPIDFDE